ncbi:hypothetical protein K458DRAFT_443662 [Lentithecium fluviatile CBS 122367]|uniref:Aminoglycoside phosphotransferase domain-containing protein n=1 Tax=Lentithecium fluviatile CBS 122367 TaxID=1168545 RepID=A0A6G1IY04_9PLEO|nr:hypothetical protein K458DRAFT_443662 [Lentithecium fluviatile CBS 122367]
MGGFRSRVAAPRQQTRIYRLPFNLYLWKGPNSWAPTHQAEFEALQLVKKHTHIPALDTCQYSDSSFLLVTSVAIKTIGSMIYIMTDEQLQGLVQDLKRNIAELRQIPNGTGSGFQICNALGGSIHDWFQDETQLHGFLGDNPPFDEAQWEQMSKAHSVKHDIVFTHADLNPRSILVDGNGRISGIVDWVCVGWYPEYWEYTKMHYGVKFTTRWIADAIDQTSLGYRDELQAETAPTTYASRPMLKVTEMRYTFLEL